MSRLVVLLLLLSVLLITTTAFPLLAIFNQKTSLPSAIRTPNPYAYLGKRGGGGFKSYAYLGKRIKPNPYAYFGKRSMPFDSFDDEFFTPEDAYRDN